MRVAAIIAVLAVVVSGCATPTGGPSPTPAAAVGSAEPGATPAPTPTDGPVESVRPASVYDIDCSAFADAAKIGTLAGVTAREATDWKPTPFSRVTPVPVVANAGGLACEFSDGGHWYDRKQQWAMNLAWRGLSIYLLPGTASSSAESDHTGCGKGSGRSYMTVCSFITTGGPNSVYVVIAVNDRHNKTYQRVYDEIVRVARAATPRPIERPERTFVPPQDCTALISPDAARPIFGGKVHADTMYEYSAPAYQAVAGGAQAGCEYWRDDLGGAVVQVLPGGAWAMDAAFDATKWEAVEVAGAPGHLSCEKEGSAQGNLNCMLELAVDGTWIEISAMMPKPSKGREVVTGLAELVLAHRAP